MANKKIRIRQRNGAVYDTLWPETFDDQVLIGDGTKTLKTNLADYAAYKSYNFIFARAEGLKGDGETDDCATLSTLFTTIGASKCEIYFTPGTYVIGSNISIPANVKLIFANGAMLAPNTGVTITIQGKIEAGLHQIFAGLGIIVFGYGRNILVEWFGAVGDNLTDDRAAVLKAIASIYAGNVVFQAKSYVISNAIVLTRNYVGLQGAGKELTYIKVNSDINDGIQIVGVSTSDRVTMAFVRDLSILKSVTPTAGRGIFCQYCAVTKIENVRVGNFKTGIWLDNANNTLISDSQVTCFAGSFDFNGYYLQNANVSSVLTNCWVDGAGNTGTKTGFKCEGDHVNDYIFNSPQVANCDYGIFIDATNAVWPCDINIYNPVIDGFKFQGILLRKIKDESSVTISGGWFNPLNTGAETDGIYIDDCRGVTIEGAQFMNLPGSSFAVGVKILTGSKGAIIRGCLFTNQNYGVLNSSGTTCIISNNNFYRKVALVGSYAILGLTAIRSLISGNVIEGYWTYGISLNAATTLSIITSNIIDPTNVTNPITATGTGVVNANNIIT